MPPPPRLLFAILAIGLPLLLLLSSSQHQIEAKRLRGLGEPCDDGEDELMKCADGLECALKATRGGKRRCRKGAGHPPLKTSSESVAVDCARAKCPVLFPDCPSDSVPVLSTGPIATDPDQCCQPTLVQCRCDPQKCLVPACRDGVERVQIGKGTQKPGECCDRFECRTSEQPNCRHVHCPDPMAAFLDLYSLDGHTCPEDSFRPDPYTPAGSCCPIVPQCQCKGSMHGSICEPARCGDGQKLVIEWRGRGEPGKCCDRYKCVPKNGERHQLNGGCQHHGMTFAEGERWHAAPCQECQCTAAGVALCRGMECPAVASGCQWVGLSPGECCPVCLGCGDEQGQTYGVGEHWERDGCTNCTCGADFRWQCQKFICQTQCENPKPVPGECCPVCDAPTIVFEPAASCPQLGDCPLRCVFGLEQDQWTGCFECKCANGTAAMANGGRVGEQEEEEQCQQLTEENCPRMCAHGYLRDELLGCPQCRCAHCPPMGNCGKICVHGWETNWMGCPICKCRGEAQQSSTIDHRTMPPPQNPMATTMMRCVSGTTERDMGEWWTEKCRQCFCQQGTEFCSLLACPARSADCPEEHWLRHEDDCCARCTQEGDGRHNGTASSSDSLTLTNDGAGQQVCHSPGTGQLFVDGQTWHLAEDECLGCTCRMGHVLCVWNNGRQCPPAHCERPVLDLSVDKCCPRCPPSDDGPTSSASSISSSSLAPSSSSPDRPFSTAVCEDNITGIVYPALAQWRRNECQSCRCTEHGNIECHRERCGMGTRGGCASGRLLSLKGLCCPICSDSLAASPTCIYEGRVYVSGEQFQDGICRNCTCLPGGLLRCLEIHCSTCLSNQQSDEDRPKAIGQCCAPCQSPAEDPRFSSFERGAEQTIFLRPGQNDRTAERSWDSRGDNDGQGGRGELLPFWLILGLGLPIVAFLLFAIGVGCPLVKCRREKAKWASGATGPEKYPVRWHLTFPDRNAVQMRYAKSGGEKESTASVSLLRLKEQKLGGENI